MDNKLKEMLDSMTVKTPKILTQIRRTFAGGKLKDASVSEPLAKNQYQIDEMDNDEMKMEFGPGVPEKIKQRAMNWAKKRGLKVKEMGLEKSDGSNSWVIFSK